VTGAMHATDTLHLSVMLNEEQTLMPDDSWRLKSLSAQEEPVNV